MTISARRSTANYQALWQRIESSAPGDCRQSLWSLDQSTIPSGLSHISIPTFLAASLASVISVSGGSHPNLERLTLSGTMFDSVDVPQFQAICGLITNLGRQFKQLDLNFDCNPLQLVEWFLPTNYSSTLSTLSLQIVGSDGYFDRIYGVKQALAISLQQVFQAHQRLAVLKLDLASGIESRYAHALLPIARLSPVQCTAHL